MADVVDLKRQRPRFDPDRQPTLARKIALAKLVVAYPTQAWPVETLDLYLERLREVPPRTLLKAVNHWIDTEPDRPSVVDLRRAVRWVETDGFVY